MLQHGCATSTVATSTVATSTPAASRTHAGQAIIQFATLIEDGSACAMKFFVDRSAFHTEVALYAACGHSSAKHPHSGPGVASGGGRDADTGKFLPRIEAIVAPEKDPEVEGMAAVADPQVLPKQLRRLPPCVVMEKGESLHDWSERGQPDFFMALSVRPWHSFALLRTHRPLCTRVP